MSDQTQQTEPRHARAAAYAAINVACLVPLLALGCAARSATDRFVYDHGAVVRGDVSRKLITLIFTGDEHGEGTEFILNTLQRKGLKASFFVTGSYIANEQHHPLLRRMVDEAHYLGPHSHAHPLYCAWQDRSCTLITEQYFKRDLQKNIDALRQFGALQDGDGTLFVPPFEWYNWDQVAWSRDMGVELMNFTPGTSSNRDYVSEGQPGFVSSEQIAQNILAYEQREVDGLNGFMLLMHLGASRQDKMHLQLPELLESLTERGYRFVRVDELLRRDGRAHK
jgi:peptidoglycan/xylan/chitin deacetylase (PgdA/CDA1 family)